MLSRFLALGLSLLLLGQARGQEYWLVSTRACPQGLGSEPLLHAYQLDSCTKSTWCQFILPSKIELTLIA
jgi:hypothetical protein